MSKLNIIVHPQAMLIISDHYTRIPYDKPAVEIKYHVGVLLGNYENDKVVVLSALEVLITDKNGKLELDAGIFKREMELHQSIYPNNKAIGWYILDDFLNKNSYENEKDKEILLSISAVLNNIDDFDNLLCGLFLPKEDDHPFHLFIQKGTDFIPTDYTYEAELAERIAMLQLQSQGDEETQIKFTENAFRSLDQDLAVIQDYLEKVAKQETAFDPTIVRACANVAQWWDHIMKSKKEGDDVSSDDDDDVADEESSVALLAGSLFEIVTLVLEISKQKKQ